MGATSSKSKQVVDTVVSVSMNLVNRSLQTCKQGVSLSQNISIRGGSGTITLRDLDWKQGGVLDVGCVQDVTYSNEMITEVQNEVANAVQQVQQALSISFKNEQDIEQLTKIAQKMATEILNESRQVCIANLRMDQAIEIVDREGVVLVEGVVWRQVWEGVQRCVAESDSVNSMKNEIATFVDNRATQETKGLLDFLGIMALLPLLLVAFVIYGFVKGGSAVTKPSVLVPFVLIVASILVVGFFKEWWPYKTSSDADSDDVIAKNKKRNRYILAGSVGALVVVTLGLYFVYRKKPSADDK